MRRVPVLLAMLALLLAGLAMMDRGDPATAQDDAQFEGSWQVTGTTADGRVMRDMLSLTADGAAIAGGTPAQPAGGANAGVVIVGVGLGSWEQSAADTVTVTYVRFRASAEGQLLGTVTVSFTLTLDPADPDRATAAGTATIADVDGNTLATIPFTAENTRFVAQAPVMQDQASPMASPTT